MFGLILLAVALAMDAFAAALCQGAVHGIAPKSGDRFSGEKMPQPERRAGLLALTIGLAFGIAQGVMPLLGYGLSLAFTAWIAAVDHWIALILLGVLGARMIREGLGREEGECAPPISGWQLLATAIATSIDAAAAGVTLPLIGLPVLFACATIGVITALISAGGVWLGSIAGTRFGKPAELLGGAVLIGLGVKIFVQHQFLGG